MPSSDDWFGRAQSFAKSQQDAISKEFSNARAKISSATDNALARWNRLSAAEQQKQAELAALMAPPTDPTARRRQAVWIGSGLILLGGASYVLYTRYTLYAGRRRPSFEQYNVPSPRGQGGLLAAIRDPFVRVSNSLANFSFSSPAPSLPPVTPMPSSSPPPPGAGPGVAAAPASSIFHRTSRSISLAWDALAPQFGESSTVKGGAKVVRRLFSTLTRAGPTRKVKAGVAYVEIELRTGGITFPLTSPSALQVIQQHMSVIDSALHHAVEHLFIGLVVDTSTLTADELNELLGAYYNAIAALAYGKQHRKSVDYAFTILLPLPRPGRGVEQLREEVRERAAAVPDLALRLFTCEDNEQAIRAREAITADLARLREEKDLAIVRSVVMEIPAPSQPSSSDPSSFSVSSSSSAAPRFRTYSDVVLGGTFDHLHAGHKIMLTLAALLAEKSLVIGLTADEMLVSKKYRETLESWQVRLQSVLAFLRIISPTLEVDLVPLHDMYGPSGDRPYLKALVVSEETAKGGDLVNIKRKENGLDALEVIVVKLARPPAVEEVVAQTTSASSAPAALAAADKISSTTLRQWDAESTARRDRFLRESWRNLCAQLKVNRDLAEETWSMLCARYNEPHRSYHTLSHISALLRQCYDASSAGLVKRQEEVELAIWFHDVVYETPTSQAAAASSSSSSSAAAAPSARAPGANELDSTSLFLSFSHRCSLSEPVRRRVDHMIRATIQHQVPEEYSEPAQGSGVSAADVSDLQYFLDFDLSILGASDAVYARYTASIRTEYIHFGIDQYRKERMAVMQKFLQRPQLYFTEEYRSLYESKARYNIRREIARMEEQEQHHV
jgi:predicted metal-dependent HD superfamily phosphohydrolase/phosphopantetheine adenylyltransferase